MKLLELLELIRYRLDDFGGDRGAPSAGYYARWQQDDAPCLWKNRELVAYLKQVLRDISHRAPWQEEGLSSDSVGDATRLAVTANNPEVELSAETLAVDQARLLSSGLLLTRTESGRLTETEASTWTTATGTPTHYLEPRAGWLRLYPIPLIADELRLIVRRRTFLDFDWTRVAHEATPSFSLWDVTDDLEEALICGVCRLAYLKNDADTFNLPLAQKYEADLITLVGPPISQRQRDARRYNANLQTAIRGYPYGGKTASSDDAEDW